MIKRSLFLAFVFLFCFFSYGDISEYPVRVRVRYFSGPGSTNLSYKTQIIVYSSEELRSCFYNSIFGMLVSPSYSSITSPTYNNSQAGFGGLLNNQISTNANNYVLSPLLFSELRPLYDGVLSLLRTGYSGPGVQEYYRTSSQLGINVNFPVLVSDVLSSTNTVFRQVLISHLSTLAVGVGSISSDISSLSSGFGRLVSDYGRVNMAVLDFTNAVDSAVSVGDMTAVNAAYFKDVYAQCLSDPSVFGDPAFFAASVFEGLRNDRAALDHAQWLNSHPGALNQFGRTFGDALGSGIGYHVNVPLTNELARLSTNWLPGVKAEMSNNTQRVRDDLKHMFDSPSSPGTAGSHLANISAAAGSLAGAVNQNRIMVTVEDNTPVSVKLDGPINIEQSQFNTLSTPVAGIKSLLDDWYRDWTYFFDVSSPGYRWRDYYDMFSRFSDRNHEDLSSITNQLLTSASGLSNVLAAVEDLLSRELPNITNSAPSDFSFLLLDDYETFIDSGRFIDMTSDLPGDLSDALAGFGFDNSSSYGRWWVFQSANMLLQSQLALTNAALSHTLLNALAEIDDSSDGSLLTRWFKLMDSFPDPEELQQSISEASNIVNNVGFDRVQELYHTVTSEFSIVVSDVFRDRPLPDSLSLVLVPAIDGRPARTVDIPVRDRAAIWTLFRMGMAFALSVITLMLFPKYLLWLLSRYTRLVERIIKSLHAYTNP